MVQKDYKDKHIKKPVKVKNEKAPKGYKKSVNPLNILWRGTNGKSNKSF